MPDIEKCKGWINEARPLLGIGDRRRMTNRNKEVTELLTSMEKIVKDDPPEYPVLRNQKQFAVFEMAFNDLASQFEKLAKNADGNTDKDEIKQVSAGLRTLKQKVRLELGKAKPTESTKVKNQLLSAARYEPAYREQRRQIENVLARLKQLPGTGAQRKILQDRLDNADASLPDFKQALRGLFFFEDLLAERYGEGLDLLEIGARETANQLPENVFKDTDKNQEFAKDYRKAELLLEDFSKRAKLANGAEVDKFRVKLRTILTAADEKKNEKVSKTAIKKAIQDLETRLDECTQAQDSVTQPKKKVEDDWATLEKTVPLSQFAELKAEKERAETLESCQLCTQAADAYRSLAQSMAKKIKDASDGPDRWAKIQKEIKGMEETLSEAEGYPELSTMVNELRTSIANARQEVTDRQDFAAGCDVIEVIREDIAALKKAAETYSVKNATVPPTAIFPDPYRTVQVKINGLVVLVQQMIQKVKDEQLKTLAEAGGDTAPFLKECEQILNRLSEFAKELSDWFEANHKRAKDKPKLLKKFLEHIDSEYKGDIVSLARDLGNRAMLVIGDNDQLKDSKKSAEAAKNTKEGNDAIAAGEKLIEQIENFHLPSQHEASSLVQRSRKTLGTLKIGANRGDNVTDQVKIVNGDLQKKIEEIGGEIKERREEVDKLTKVLNGKIKSLQDRNFQRLLNNPNIKYKDFFDTLRTEVAVAAGKRSSQVASVSAAGEQALKDLETKLDNLANTLEDGKSYGEVEKKISSLKDEVEAIKKQDRRTHAKLEHVFEKVLLPEVHKLLPDEAKARLTEFENNELKTAKKTASDLTEKIKKFKEEATQVRKDLEKTDLKSTAPALFNSLMARRQAAKDVAADNTEFAYSELNAIKLLMQSATKDKKKAATLNENAKVEEFDSVRRKEEFSAAQHVFEMSYGQDVEDFARYTRPDEYKQMRAYIKQAEKLAHNTPPDFAAARENMDKAIETAKFMIDNCTDDTSPIGRNLQNLNNSWKTRVSTYLRQLSTLSTTLKAATDDQNVAIAAKPVEKALGPLHSLFDPKAFDKFIEELSKTPKSATALDVHRKVKEQALVRIRRYQDQFKKNSLLLHVAGNPVSEVAVKPLRDTLTGLYAEVLGS